MLTSPPSRLAFICAATLALGAALLLAACDDGSTLGAPSPAATSPSSDAAGSAAPSTDTPTPSAPVLNARLFVNNHVYGPDNGCSSTLRMPSGSIQCGHDLVSKVAWRLVRASPASDQWTFTRTIVTGDANVAEETKTVTFDGTKTITLFEDDVQRVTLGPVPDDEQ